MKTCLFLLSLLAVLAGTVNLSAAPRVSLGTVRGFPGNTVEVPLWLRFDSNDVQNVVALQADVVFATGGLVTGTPGSGEVLGSHLLRSSLPGAGVRRILIYSTHNAPLTNGIVARLPFTVPAGQFQNFPITLANVVLASASATAVAATTGAGGIAVNQVYVRPDGDADFFMNVTPGQPYTIQASTNLLDWVNLSTTVAEGSIVLQIDTDAHLYPHRFYRALPTGGVIGRVALLTGGRLSFQLAGAEGRTYLIQASTNLQEWVDAGTAVAAGGTLTITNSIDPNIPTRFYRLKLEP